MEADYGIPVVRCAPVDRASDDRDDAKMNADDSEIDALRCPGSDPTSVASRIDTIAHSVKPRYRRPKVLLAGEWVAIPFPLLCILGRLLGTFAVLQTARGRPSDEAGIADDCRTTRRVPFHLRAKKARDRDIRGDARV